MRTGVLKEYGRGSGEIGHVTVKVLAKPATLFYHCNMADWDALLDLDYWGSVHDRTFGATRSPLWPALAKAHLKIQPLCMACGTNLFLNVHHVKPFHLYPKLELDPTNLLTLCESKCHIHHGHLGDFRSYNRRVVVDARSMLKKIKSRP